MKPRPQSRVSVPLMGSLQNFPQASRRFYMEAPPPPPPPPGSFSGFVQSSLIPAAIKAGLYLKAVFWLGIMFLMQISRLRFKQSRICSLITHIYVLRRFVNFLVIFRFIWRQIVFLKGLVKFMEIGNFEDLVLF